MSLPYPISAAQTKAKAVIDDNLMDSIRGNLNYLDVITTSGGVPVYPWNINGKLRTLPGRIAKRIDMQFLHAAQTFSRVRLAQEKSGSSGVTEIDIRYHSTPKTPIIEIAHKFSLSTTSISQIAPGLATQSIVRATTQVATQSISRAKSTKNIQSIISLGSNLWRINLDTAVDTDWKVGDSILVGGATTGTNNGTFVIVEANQSGWPSVVVSNASGAAQNAASGTVDLQCFSYNLVNPANAHFVAGESIITASHTTPANNGTLTIYAINSGGNNIWIKNPTGATQAGILGTCDTTRWIYAYGSAVSTDFRVGDKARFASHTTPANNADLTIVAINSGGNNIIVSNVAGVAQGAAAGTANTLLWKYSFASDPSANVVVGESVVTASHTTSANNGTFTVVKVNDTTANNVVVYNASGVAQAAAAGTVTHTHKLVKFSSDQSLIYSAGVSYVEIFDTPDGSYRAVDNKLPFKVLEVNRGGGANYNIVISNEVGLAQLAPAGYIGIEGRSIFTAADGSKPQLSADLVGLTPNGVLKATYTGSAIAAVAIPAQTYLGLYILQIQAGAAENLTVVLS